MLPACSQHEPQMLSSGSESLLEKAAVSRCWAVRGHAQWSVDIGVGRRSSANMDAASSELAEAGRRQAEISRLINECEQKLADLHHKHSREGGGRGSGRWKKADQNSKDALEGNLKLLRNGVLPNERRATERASAASVQEGAQANAEHHAARQPAPSGRPSTKGSSSAAGGSGATADRASDDDVPDHDDGEESDALRKANYYAVSAQQKAFNEEKTRHFIKTAANQLHAYIEPPDVSKSGCNPAYIGVGKLHVHAPHLYLGFAKPPCPTCGWKSVANDTVKSWGICPARRVYATETDEWVAGQLMLCTVCKQGSDRLKREWKELQDYYEDDEFSEVKEAEAAWKAKTYTYRSYNKDSLKLYAERYPGCAPHTH